MERVGVLINKLKEQYEQKADIDSILVTTQLLNSELAMSVKKNNGSSYKRISVIVPHEIASKVDVKVNEHHNGYKPVNKPEAEPEPLSEPIVEPQATPPASEPEPSPKPKPEPEPVPHFTGQKPWQVFSKKEEKVNAWALDPVFEVPTLAHQEKIVYELNDSLGIEGVAASLNDKLKHNKSELGNYLQDSPIKDLKKAISINDRHRFIHELFRDDETMYERSIKTINGFNIYAEAEYWIQRELKVKLGWDSTQELVKTFDQLVKRRFS